MKKLKKFIKDNGGWKIFLFSLVLILVASFLIIVGVVYTNFEGDWGRIPEMLSSEFAIAVYVIMGLVIFALFYITIIYGRTKEIE